MNSWKEVNFAVCNEISSAKRRHNTIYYGKDDGEEHPEASEAILTTT
jgi:hypothetical protein